MPDLDLVVSAMRDLDLVVDLNTMDDSGMPWAFIDAAPDPVCNVPGHHVLVQVT